jgi:hypothetical protein
MFSRNMFSRNMFSRRMHVFSIDVNYVNVNAFYFYFTRIVDENNVKDIFYILPLRLSLFLFPKVLLFHWSDFPFLLTGTSSHGAIGWSRFVLPPGHGCTYSYTEFSHGCAYVLTDVPTAIQNFSHGCALHSCVEILRYEMATR